MSTITTDNKWKNFKYSHEVPPRILKDQFDYLDDETTDGFIHYKGTWYHTSQFIRMPNDGVMPEWDGIAADSFSTGVVIKLSDDGEQYKIGTYIA